MSIVITKISPISIFNFSYRYVTLFLEIGKNGVWGMNVDYKMIGERIQRARKSRNMTQDVLAERLDVSVGYVSQVERGITKISLDLLGAISSALDYDIAYFVSESAINHSEYMESEISSELKKMDGRKKKLIIDIIKKVNEHL